MSFDYGAHSAVINTTDTVTPVKLGGILSMGMPMNTDMSTDDNGQIEDSFSAVIMQAPQPQFRTKSVAEALKAMTYKGICINVDGTHPGVKFYGEAKSDCQQGEPASNGHLSYLMDGGLMVPTQLTASRREPAQLSVEIDTISKNLNAPFAANYADTLPTGLNIDEYILGAMKIGNLLWSDARTFTCDFNNTRADREPGLGSLWPERSARRKVRPRITVGARDPRKLDDAAGIPFLGKKAVHTDTVFYFRKRDNGGALIDVALLQHFKLTVQGTVVFDNPFSVSGDASAETSLMIYGRKDDTNPSLIFTFGIAYNPAP